MEVEFDDIKAFLPRFLSEGDLEALYSELKSFPDNCDSRLYMQGTDSLEFPLQGDGIKDLLVIQLPNPELRAAPCIILSNTCDIAIDNRRAMQPRVTYAPIIRTDRYEAMLRSSGFYDESALLNHMASVRRQFVSNLLYLPRGGRLDYDGIALLDCVNNCPAEALSEGTLPERRLFSLSNYGFYLFLLKVSIHFTRIRDKINRG